MKVTLLQSTSGLDESAGTPESVQLLLVGVFSDASCSDETPAPIADRAGLGQSFPITATDRVPADEQLGKPGNISGSEETQMTITRREILHRAYPSLHPACPHAACQGVTL